ncbi:MAG TPA: tripartite tricarboxylate transporter substrate binding protein [Burkholderiales bacterium]|nr:tripartite tricarboxylate transporter substrate binding protein [Burkholderiales bacterium]
MKHRNFVATRLRDLSAIALAAALQSPGADAADYPVRQVRMIVGAVTGGGVDITARVVAAKLSELLGQQFFVDNRPGAGGNIGSEVVAKSAPDGYTLLMGTIAVLAINPSLYKDLPVDPVRDFAPISRAADSTNILVVHPALPVKNVKQLIALAKTRPGELVYGSSGVGTAGHLSGELFSSMAAVKMVHVPYKGGPPSMIDLIAGRLQLVFATAVVAVPQINAGKIKALAVTTAKRSVFAPELPTIAEAGLPGFEANNWYGLVAPAKTPGDVLSRLNKEVVALLKLPDVKETLFKQGIEAAPGTAEEFGAYIKSEITKWGRIVKASGATAN